MILFNTTFIVDVSAKAPFISWARNTLIPEAVASGIFTDPLMTRILPPDDEPCESESFAVQLKAESEDAVKSWQEKNFPSLFLPLAEEYPQSVLPFSTFMEII